MIYDRPTSQKTPSLDWATHANRRGARCAAHAELPSTLAEIARIQAKAGAPVAAKQTLREAFESAKALPRRDSVFGERVLRVVEAQGEIGDVEGAKASAALIENDNVDKALALAALARAQAKAGDASSARATVHDALTLANGSLARPNFINDDPDANSLRVLRQVALAQAETGYAKDALKTVAGKGTDAWRSETLAAIPPIQARLGDVPGALTTVRSIPDATRAGEAYSSIASIQARTGDAKVAFSWASRLDGPVAKAFALIGITEGLAARKADKPGAH